VDHLRGQKIGALWVGLDERNVAARTFYEKLEFRGIKGAPDNFMALDFEAGMGMGKGISGGGQLELDNFLR